MKKNRILALLLVVVMLFTLALTACKKVPVDDQKPNENPGVNEPDNKEPEGNDPVQEPETVLLPYEAGTVLRIAAGYQKINEAISFQDAEVTGEGVKLADGNTYMTGDLKPTWVQVAAILGVEFEDKFSGAGSAEKEFSKWENELDKVDIIAGSASKLQEAGAAGKVINIAEYLDQMPNFKAYLEENPLVRLSITGDTSNGSIYFSPYFDGVDDIERYPLMRVDLIEALLDGDTAYAGENRLVAAGVYQPYMPTEGKVEVLSLTADGTGTQTIVKDYSKAPNIIAQMNNAQGLTGDAAVQMLRTYIDNMYGDTYAKRSDLFLGYDAAWDADELVALLRCAVASLNDENGNPVTGLYSRETTNTQREVDLFRFAGSLFGVRGMESRQDYLYFDKDGALHDARQEEDAYVALERMNAMFKEGLIAMTGAVTSADYLKMDAGIVSYDYCQTQTILNGTALNAKGANPEDSGEKYTVAMVPVALWHDGSNDNGVWMRFTESWRSVKTDGWAISKDGVGNDENKLNAALKLIDFAFSVQGQITMSYGSDAFIKVKDASVEVKTWDDVAKKYETFNFNGREMPVVTDEMFADLQEKTGGNYTNYARRYLGSTLNGFPKSQAFEYQCTHEVGKEGAAKVSAAIANGTIKHPLLAVNTENMWYTSIPTTLPTNANQNAQLASYTELTAGGKFSSSKNGYNIFLDLIQNGYTIDGFAATDAATAAKIVSEDWMGTQYLMIKTSAWEKLLKYYESISK